MMELPNKPWFWPHEAAKVLRVSRRTILRYCESGELLCRTLPSGFHQVSNDSLKKKLGQVGQVGQP